ncbi:hypothetical protein HFD88_004243 [Aspergillus terreus]|nr:hypothetical protein HFD88_004243 [Aspergillus terreus]
MEQLGLYEKLASLGMPLNKLKTFAPGGRLLSDQPTAGDLFEEVFGYRMFFLDRQALLQTLYDSIGDKSRICTSSEVFKVETLDGSAFVTTRSGAVYPGDIVVGADGVRITCTYKCLFGISQRPDGVPDEHGFKTFQEGRSYLYQSGLGGKLYWFLFIKNPEVTIHHSIPRYSAENTKDVVEKYAGDILLPGLTPGDLYKLRVNAVLVPVEEFVLDRCFTKGLY